jgi:hypothetical protein
MTAFDWLADWIYRAMDALGKAIFDGILAIADFVFGSVPAGTLTGAPGLGSLPPDVLCLLGAVGFPAAVGIITSAILIRIPLSLVFKG